MGAGDGRDFAARSLALPQMAAIDQDALRMPADLGEKSSYGVGTGQLVPQLLREESWFDALNAQANGCADERAARHLCKERVAGKNVNEPRR